MKREYPSTPEEALEAVLKALITPISSQRRNCKAASATSPRSPAYRSNWWIYPGGSVVYSSPFSILEWARRRPRNAKPKHGCSQVRATLRSGRLEWVRVANLWNSKWPRRPSLKVPQTVSQN